MTSAVTPSCGLNVIRMISVKGFICWICDAICSIFVNYIRRKKVFFGVTNEELVLNIQSGEIDRKEGLKVLYLKNHGLIHNFIKPFLRDTSVDSDDLMQEGFIGMMKAVDSFDCSKGTKFMTYAMYQIQRQAQLFVSKDDAIRLPQWIYQLNGKRLTFIAEYQNEHGKEPDEETIRDALGLSKLQYSRYKAVMNKTNCVSLDCRTHDEDGDTVADIVPDPQRFDEELIDSITDEENKRILWDCVDSLPRRQPEVVRKHIIDDMNYREVGESLGVSRQRAERIIKTAYKELKNDERILMIARTEGLLSGSLAYKGSLKTFKNHNTSVVEKIAIDRVERERRFLEDKKTVDCFVANNVF